MTKAKIDAIKLIEQVKAAGSYLSQIEKAKELLELTEGNSYSVMSKPMGKGVIRVFVGSFGRRRIVIDYSEHSEGVFVVSQSGLRAKLNEIEDKQ